MGTKIALASTIEPYFEEQCVGVRVRDAMTFMSELESTVEKHEFPESGRSRVFLGCHDAIYSGVARRHQLEVGDYVVRRWRGEFGLFACRKMALEVKQIITIVCAREAYLRDRSVSAHEALRIAETGCQYVLVDVLVDPPLEGRALLSSRMFVRNIAENETWLAEHTIGSLAKVAQEIAHYEQEFVAVSD